MKTVTDQEYAEAYDNRDNTNIIHAALRPYNSMLDVDERKECGMLALWEAMKNHDPTKGQKFTTTLYKYVRWHAQRAIQRKHQEKLKADNFCPANPETFYVGDFIEKVELEDLMNKLEERDRTILRQKYIEGYTLQEIGEFHGFTREAARQNLKKARRKLRKLAYN